MTKFNLVSNIELMPRIYPEEIKQKAIQLREQGLTYPEIQSLLSCHVPKNTFTGWFKRIQLSKQARLRILKKIEEASERGRAHSQVWKVNHQKRVDLISGLRKKVSLEFQQVDNLTAKIALAMLYLAEGGKTNEFIRFGNSNPKIIQLFLTLFRKTFPLEETKLRGKVQCRADQNIKELESFWSELSGIPSAQFVKPQIDLRTTGKPTKRESYKGVFVVEYYSNSIFFELMFISDIIYDHIVNKGP